MEEVFLYAVQDGSAGAVRALLADPRVNPTASNQAIQLASWHGHVEVVRVLLADSRINPTTDKNDAIQQASRNGHVAVVRVLLADPRVDPSDDENLAIKWASRFDHTEVVRALLADPRVDPRDAIRKSKTGCARIIASNGGIEQNYDLFEKYHPDIVREYEARLRQCYAVAWVATQECGWIDVVEPVVKRLKVLL